GECPGQNRETPGSCTCQCQKTDLGPLTEPGGMTCNLGTHLVVEQLIGDPCDGNDILVDVGTGCIPMTTDTAEATVHDVNNQLVCKSSGALCGSGGGCTAGEQCDCDPGDTCDFNVFHKVATGAPVTCDQLRDTGVTGLHTEGVVDFFGSDLGDILTQVSTNCEEAPKCPLVAGSYTIRQTTGGQLKVDGLPPFPFPS